MCGIVAVWQRDGRPCRPADVIAMRDILIHRGPDDAGLYIDGAVGLGHRRLSILDLSAAGHQPMSNEDGSVWLVFNGEIYNYVELTSVLRARGHTFRSATDSEVILHLYEEEGPRCLNSLNGMFAFVIWDSRTRTMFAARDRIGIKPLYYHLKEGLFGCASEAKAILAHPEIPTAVDDQGLADYLFAGAPLGHKTLFSGVRQLPPAHMLILSASDARIERYWDVAYRYQEGRANHQIVGDLNELIDDAVRIHCRSDAPVGCHLSGGLDSSLVSSVAARHRGEMDAFSVRFGESAFYDETEYASVVAQTIGARHHIVTPEARDLMSLLGPLTWHQDFPTRSPGGFSYFSASRLAARSVKVVLTGHGGDEVFGGYPAQFQATFGTTEMFDLSKFPPNENATTGQRFARLLRRQGLLGIARQLSRRLSRRPNHSESLEAQWIKLHGGCDPARNPLLHPAFVRRIGDYSPAHDYLQPLVEAPTDQIFDRCLYQDLLTYLPDLLMIEDRASMAVSLESRVPLLDYRIIEYMATVPPEDKVTQRVPKALLRKVAAEYLPAFIVNRNDKTPFPVPLREWIASQLTPQIRALLGSEASLERGIFNPRVLRDPGLSPGEMLAMLKVEVWFRVFIDRDPEWLPAGPEASRVAFAGLPPLAMR
jgi:asparagine synthase (glutamine-hydrolysing)